MMLYLLLQYPERACFGLDRVKIRVHGLMQNKAAQQLQVSKPLTPKGTLQPLELPNCYTISLHAQYNAQIFGSKGRGAHGAAGSGQAAEGSAAADSAAAGSPQAAL